MHARDMIFRFQRPPRVVLVPWQGKGVLDFFAGLRLGNGQAGLAGGGGNFRAFNLDPRQVALWSSCHPDGAEAAQTAGGAIRTFFDRCVERKEPLGPGDPWLCGGPNANWAGQAAHFSLGTNIARSRSSQVNRWAGFP